MIDPSLALDPYTYIRWRLDCLAAVSSGLPWPPMPCRHQPEAAAEDDVGDPYGGEVLHWIIERLEETERAQGQD